MGACVVCFGLTFHVIGVIINVIGVATSNWLEWSVDEEIDGNDFQEVKYRIGLFRQCSDQMQGHCQDFPEVFDSGYDELEAAQAATLTGMLLGILSLFLSGAYWATALSAKKNGRGVLLAFLVFTYVLAPLATAAGAALYFLKMEAKLDGWSISNIGYSGYCCVVGMLAITVLGSIAPCGANCVDSPSPSSPSTENPSPTGSNKDSQNTNTNTVASSNGLNNAPGQETNPQSPGAYPASPDVRNNMISGQPTPQEGFYGPRPTSPTHSTMNETRPAHLSQQTIYEGRPASIAPATQPFHDGAPNQSAGGFANESRPIARSQSINTHGAYYNPTMPTQYGAADLQ